MRHTTHAVRFLVLAVLAGIAFSDSSAFAGNTPQETANKEIVLDYFAALNHADDTNTVKKNIDGIAEKYLSPDYTQHSVMFENLPGPGSERDRLVRFFKAMAERRRGPVAAQKTVAVMAEGDRVILLTSRDAPDPKTGAVKTSYVFNMFRISNGKLIEHWDDSAIPASMLLAKQAPSAGIR